MREDAEFYVGYLPGAPPGLAARTRRVVLALYALAVVVAVVLVASQRPFARGTFEFGVVRDWEGILAERPVPMLRVARPGIGAGQPLSRYLLVAPGKFGAAGSVSGLDGRSVRLEGSLVHRDGTTMIELSGVSVREQAGGADDGGPARDLGNVSLVGEIVDAKCWLGVMKPGDGKTHRSCAVRCISGGIPPLFVVHEGPGATTRMLLVGADGRAVNRDVLDLVGEPVRITGLLERQGDLLVLRADPSGYRRVAAAATP